MLRPLKLSQIASFIVAFFVSPVMAMAELPPPQDLSNIPQPKEIVEHQVEEPSPLRPMPPMPLNRLHAPPLEEQYIEYNDSYEPTLTQRDLPAPPRGLGKPVMVTLQDAILLALRYNPNVESSQLTRIDDKYNLYLVQRDFVPVYTLGAGSVFTSANRPLYNAAAGVTVRTPLGTQLGLAYNTTFPAANGSSFGTAAFTLTQPLLQGFGFVNKIPLLNAYDSEEIAKLSFKSSIIGIVDQVINSYRSMVSDYNNLDIQKSNLDSTKVTTEQYRLKLRAGQMAPSELIQQEAQLAQAKLTYEQQRIQVEQDYRAFMIGLGLTVNANLKINGRIDCGKL